MTGYRPWMHGAKEAAQKLERQIAARENCPMWQVRSHIYVGGALCTRDHQTHWTGTRDECRARADKLNAAEKAKGGERIYAIGSCEGY